MSDLRSALRSLPKGLDDTYARILQDIDNKGYGDQVAKILQWLAYSRGPMSLNAIAEVLTVDIESDLLVDFERRPADPQDILELCSSLISIGLGIDHETESLRFAHFSVREFLESPRVDNGPARKFAVDEMRASILTAESCIAYILRLDSVKVSLDTSTIYDIYEKYPLSRFAASQWNLHAKTARENGRIISLCERLFRSDSSELSSRLRIFRRSTLCDTFLSAENHAKINTARGSRQFKKQTKGPRSLDVGHIGNLRENRRPTVPPQPWS